jgi:hypothetical protein
MQWPDTDSPLGAGCECEPRAPAVLRAIVLIVDRLRSSLGSLRRSPRPFGATESPAWLQRVLTSSLESGSLLEYLSRRPGAEELEFLLACRHFEQSHNALQRFEQLRIIIHKFVRDNAERPAQISDAVREKLLHDWACWSVDSRVPAGARLRGLESAALEVHDILAARGPLSPLENRVASHWRRNM